MLDLTRHLLAPGGYWLAMKGMIPQAELEPLGKTYRVEIQPLQVPGERGQRHGILIHPAV